MWPATTLSGKSRKSKFPASHAEMLLTLIFMKKRKLKKWDLWCVFYMYSKFHVINLSFSCRKWNFKNISLIALVSFDIFSNAAPVCPVQSHVAMTYGLACDWLLLRTDLHNSAFRKGVDSVRLFIYYAYSFTRISVCVHSTRAAMFDQNTVHNSRKICAFLFLIKS